MKNLARLQLLTKILFIISMIAIILMPGFILIYIISPDSVPDTIKLSGFNSLDWFLGIIVLVMLAGYCLFIYALYLFRQILDLFAKMKIFDDLVIALFNKIAKCITIGLSIIIISRFILTAVNTHNVKLNFNTNSISGILFVIILSIFFKVLAEVFQKAKAIKEENDLTV